MKVDVDGWIQGQGVKTNGILDARSVSVEYVSDKSRRSWWVANRRLMC